MTAQPLAHTPNPGSPLAQRRRPPSAASLAWARVGLELTLFFREKQQVVFSFAYPVAMLVIFGSITGNGQVAGGVTFTQYFVPGILATGIMLTSFQALGIDIAVERESGGLARLQALGTPAISYFAGKVGQVLVTTAAQIVLLLVTARVFFDVAPPHGAGWLTFAWVGVLGSLAGTVLGIAVSGLPKTGRSAATVISPIALVLQFFSGVFFVFSSLPGWMQEIAAVFPLKWLTQGMRSVFLPIGAASAEVAGSWEHGRTAAVLALWSVIGLLICARTFTWRKDGA